MPNMFKNQLANTFPVHGVVENIGWKTAGDLRWFTDCIPNRAKPVRPQMAGQDRTLLAFTWWVFNSLRYASVCFGRLIAVNYFLSVPWRPNKATNMIKTSPESLWYSVGLIPWFEYLALYTDKKKLNSSFSASLDFKNIGHSNKIFSLYKQVRKTIVLHCQMDKSKYNERELTNTECSVLCFDLCWTSLCRSVAHRK